MSFTTCLVIMLGGALGTLCRYAVSLAAAPISTGMPWGTILANVSGSFLIGFFGTLTLAHGRFPVPESLRLFVMIGFCGGYTTFSSFSLQTLDMLRAGLPVRAGLHIALSVVTCIAFVALGHALGARFNGGATEIAQAAIEEDA